jgi:hypothetical protein
MMSPVWRPPSPYRLETPIGLAACLLQADPKERFYALAGCAVETKCRARIERTVTTSRLRYETVPNGQPPRFSNYRKHR